MAGIFRMSFDRVSLRVVGVIRLVVADADRVVFVQSLQQRPGEAVVLFVPQHTDMPRSRTAVAQRRGEAMDRDKHRCLPALYNVTDRVADGILIGPEVFFRAFQPLVMGEFEVAGEFPGRR